MEPFMSAFFCLAPWSHFLQLHNKHECSSPKQRPSQPTVRYLKLGPEELSSLLGPHKAKRGACWAALSSGAGVLLQVHAGVAESSAWQVQAWSSVSLLAVSQELPWAPRGHTCALPWAPPTAKPETGSS